MGFSSAAKKHGYRSGLEHTVAAQIKKRGMRVKYEDPSSRIAFTQPACPRTYTPDFVLKHLWIKEQHGDELDIRFVFSNSRSKIRKGSKTSYANWCEKNGFLYADKLIPEEWFNETGTK